MGDAAEILAGTDPLGTDTDGGGMPDDSDPSPLPGVLYRHADRLGSSVVVTAAAGSVLERAVYRPYGEAVAPVAGGPVTPPEFGFTGQRFVSAAGIYDYGARMYDPTLGRFLQPDVLVPDLYAPQSLNRYAYVLNDPVNRVDPSGNLSFDIGFGFGTLSFDSSLIGNGSFGFGLSFGPSLGLSFDTGTALNPGFGFSAIFSAGEGVTGLGFSLPTSSTPEFSLPDFNFGSVSGTFSSPVVFNQPSQGGASQGSRLDQLVAEERNILGEIHEIENSIDDLLGEVFDVVRPSRFEQGISMLPPELQSTGRFINTRSLQRDINRIRQQADPLLNRLESLDRQLFGNRTDQVGIRTGDHRAVNAFVRSYRLPDRFGDFNSRLDAAIDKALGVPPR